MGSSQTQPPALSRTKASPKVTSCPSCGRLAQASCPAPCAGRPHTFRSRPSFLLATPKATPEVQAAVLCHQPPTGPRPPASSPRPAPEPTDSSAQPLGPRWRWDAVAAGRGGPRGSRCRTCSGPRVLRWRACQARTGDGVLSLETCPAAPGPVSRCELDPREAGGALVSPWPGPERGSPLPWPPLPRGWAGARPAPATWPFAVIKPAVYGLGHHPEAAAELTRAGREAVWCSGQGPRGGSRRAGSWLREPGRWAPCWVRWPGTADRPPSRRPQPPHAPRPGGDLSLRPLTRVLPLRAQIWESRRGSGTFYRTHKVLMWSHTRSPWGWGLSGKRSARPSAPEPAWWGGSSREGGSRGLGPAARDRVEAGGT